MNEKLGKSVKCLCGDSQRSILCVSPQDLFCRKYFHGVIFVCVRTRTHVLACASKGCRSVEVRLRPLMLIFPFLELPTIPRASQEQSILLHELEHVPTSYCFPQCRKTHVFRREHSFSYVSKFTMNPVNESRAGCRLSLSGTRAGEW